VSRYALPLDGYDNASIWGFDEQSASYFAQLWRNTSDSFDDPDIWLSGVSQIGSPERLAMMIAGRASKPVAEVARAMAAAKTAPEAAQILEFADNLCA
jgi:hypothetical protein